MIDEMRNIALLRHRQGWPMQEVLREFDVLAQLLDAAALRWIQEYPGTPRAADVGRVFGRLNRVPLLMGQIMVKALEEERRDLLQQLASAEEEERIRLSRELHDQLGQQLTALMLGLKALERGPGAVVDARAIAELERLAERTARETQNLARGLRPPALDNLGLRLALEDLAVTWSALSGAETHFHCAVADGERYTADIETAVYRIAQEALNNVLKHADASNVSIILERRDGSLSLVVEDDGRGFDLEQTLARKEIARRLGIRGMRERAARLGGSLEIESSIGSGTTLFVRIPDGEQAGRK